MRYQSILTIGFTLLLAVSAPAQIDEFCKEFGFSASLDAPRLMAPFIYGRVSLAGNAVTSRVPKISVLYSGRAQAPSRVSVGKSGSFCFRGGGGGGLLTVDVDGIEVARREVSEFGSAQKREDFQVAVPGSSLVASKFSYPPNEKTVGRYEKAVDLEKAGDLKGAEAEIKKIVEID